MSQSKTLATAKSTGSKARSSLKLSPLLQGLAAQQEQERRQILGLWQSNLKTLDEGLRSTSAAALSSTERDIRSRLTGTAKRVQAQAQDLETAVQNLDSLAGRARALSLIAAGAVLGIAFAVALAVTWYSWIIGEQVAQLHQDRAALLSDLARLPTPPTQVQSKAGFWVRIDPTDIISLGGQPGAWARVQ